MVMQKMIGIRIKNIRESLNLTLEGFAEKTHLSSRFISDVENGKRGLSVESLRAICLAFDISADYIIFGKDTSLSSPLGDILAQIPYQYNLNLIAEGMLKSLVSTIHMSEELITESLRDQYNLNMEDVYHST